MFERGLEEEESKGGKRVRGKQILSQVLEYNGVSERESERTRSDNCTISEPLSSEMYEYYVVQKRR